jgi:tetratricopeptide (TPR) repeat protein
VPDKRRLLLWLAHLRAIFTAARKMRNSLFESVLQGILVGIIAWLCLLPFGGTYARLVQFSGLGALVGAIAAAGSLAWRAYYRSDSSPSLLKRQWILGPYVGLLCGFLGATLADPQTLNASFMLTCMLMGVLLGVAAWRIRSLTVRLLRVGLAWGLCLAFVAWIFWEARERVIPDALGNWPLHWITGALVYSLFVVLGSMEETEVEPALALGLLALAAFMPGRGNWPDATLFGAVLLVALPTAWLAPCGLRLLRWRARGRLWLAVGNAPRALEAYERMLQVDCGNEWAQKRAWRIEEQLSAKSDFDVESALSRVESMCIVPKPSPPRLNWASQLLERILQHDPERRAIVDYWQAVIHTHKGQLEQAATALEHVLDPEAFAPADPHRNEVLFAAWRLALALHPELRRHVGNPQLHLPDRRMEAIGAVERQLAIDPDDAIAWEMKRRLYGELREDDYLAAAGGRPGLRDFDHAYGEEWGRALLANPAMHERALEYLRMAAHGSPGRAASIFRLAADLERGRGQEERALEYLELAKRAGQAAERLSSSEETDYMSAIKALAERAQARGDIDEAIANYLLYSKGGRGGIESAKTLALLYEQRGNALEALRAAEQGLVYDPLDKDLLERRDRYYYSVTLEDVERHKELLKGIFDVGYCIEKATWLLRFPEADQEVIAWAAHLTRLALVMDPLSSGARLQLARALRRQGQARQGAEVLDGLSPEPARGLISGEDENAWFACRRLLGEIYLYDLNEPARAIPCFLDYRRSSQSGADTLYKLGQAYERTSDQARAIRCYEQVTGYHDHPLAAEAYAGLDRLRQE